jgi:hypothetical protein
VTSELRPGARLSPKKLDLSGCGVGGDGCSCRRWPGCHQKRAPPGPAAARCVGGRPNLVELCGCWVGGVSRLHRFRIRFVRRVPCAPGAVCARRYPPRRRSPSRTPSGPARPRRLEDRARCRHSRRHELFHLHWEMQMAVMPKRFSFSRHVTYLAVAGH